MSSLIGPINKTKGDVVLPCIPVTHDPVYSDALLSDTQPSMSISDNLSSTNSVLSSSLQSVQDEGSSSSHISIPVTSIQQQPSITNTQSLQHTSVRQSARSKQQPSYLNDYYVNSVSDSCSIPTFTHSHKAFIANILKLQEPHTHNQAQVHKEWRNVMQAEIRALE
ncbi:hypothetical protein LIER_34226 [Lithospermum erythrorhizon]|uniref:Uncharacterized protein n=1 Tax=Lithospermum erythrorhizon TaxID=34254 RepID=A0AAV3S0S6_LITER